MFASPSGVVRPLPPSPPQGDDAEHLNLNETTFDGPPRLPPMDSFHDQSHGPQSNGTPPLPGPSSRPASPPQSPAIQGGNSRPRNPLTDLIDSEEQFVSLMSAIIRKVASAWSRSNFPPPELDRMFRAIEAVFKASRTFLTQLKEIGPNPSSPKALGDLLMRWVDDLEQPYSRYCEAFATGFDQWEPIQSNAKLYGILSDLSNAIPTPPNVDPPLWTLDSLFLLPRTRLKYYKKLYVRLLRSTTEGKSDHALLLDATATLERLFTKAESRLDVIVGEPVVNQEPPPVMTSNPMRDIDRDLPPPPPLTDLHQGRDSYGSSGRASSRSSGQRISRDTGQTSLIPTTSLGWAAIELERKLSTERVLDIFNMEPRQCRLQINPANLPFTRELRLDTDCVIYFTPSSTGQQLATTNAHIFILTDLFLVCQHMTPEEKLMAETELWISYPPLSGKVLKVSDVQGGPGEHVVQVVILKKETLYIHLETAQLKEQVLREFAECKEAAQTGSNRSNAPPPPLPPPYGGPNGINRPPSAPNSERRLSPYSEPQRPGGHMSDPPPLRFQENGQVFPARIGSLPAGNPHSPPPPGPPMGGGIGLPGVGLPGMGMAPQPFGSPPPGGMGGQFMPPPRGSSTTQGFGPHRVQTAPGSIAPNPMGPPGAPFLPRNPNHLGPVPPPLRQPSPGAGGPMPPGPPFDNGMPPMGPGMMRPGPPPFAGPPQQFGSPRMSMAPSLAMQSGPRPGGGGGHPDDHSPPTSPTATGPTTTSITATMRCKVFLKQQHQQWKALGSGKLKLYHTVPTNVKQMVVESDSSSKTMIMSSIVLTDGVERVGKTGVAVEMSDGGARTGVVYMVQLRNEQSTQGLFDSLLAGSDRAVGGPVRRG
ncbi:hypothetical protein FRC19_003512 [Serendipita sp. 401]|nr:hypothetical protein FRC19_003512 [Serendipita sp. 401]